MSAGHDCLLLADGHCRLAGVSAGILVASAEGIRLGRATVTVLVVVVVAAVAGACGGSLLGIFVGGGVAMVSLASS